MSKSSEREQRATIEYAGFMTASIWSQDVPRSPVNALIALGEARVALDERVTAFVAQARREDWTWRAIGIALGISRQAAQQRYGG